MTDTVRDIPLGHEVVGRALKGAVRVRGDLVGWVSWVDARGRERLAASVKTPTDHDMRPTTVAGSSIRRPSQAEKDTR